MGPKVLIMVSNRKGNETLFAMAIGRMVTFMEAVAPQAIARKRAGFAFR